MTPTHSRVGDRAPVQARVAAQSSSDFIARLERSLTPGGRGRICNNLTQQDKHESLVDSPVCLGTTTLTISPIALWSAAENPEPFHFVDARADRIPLKTELKPTLKVLQRKPIEAPRNRHAAADDDDDSEAEERKRQQAAFEERSRRAALEREEKQRLYAEARERIMGPLSA
ncbi:hypothetical protein MRB53_039520 [Persea americana]|nr:hypothetical protein MRB53_039520 [Persea americana]